MRARRSVHLVVACLVAFAVAGGAPATAWGAVPVATSPVEISLSRTQVSTPLGDSFTFSSTITNTRAVPASGLVAHLNILSFTHGVYVDPEDWSSQRTRYLDPLPPGHSVRIDWPVKAVTGGDMGIYVTVLATPGTTAEPPPPTISPTLEAHVAEHRVVNPGGVLPLALGIPAALALAMGGLRARRRSLRT
jgi:hypothetical protein